MNVVAFIPIGFLLGCSFRRMRLWKIIVIGICMSTSVESMQFRYKRGFAELDDMMHNTLGCIIGYGFCCMVAWIIKNYRSSGCLK